MTKLSEIKENIQKACKDCGRKVEDVELMAVSKFQSVEDIESVINEGQFLFGENRVQEAIKKFEPLREKYSNIKVHLIGSLQTNKVKEAVSFFDCIQSVDRIELAEKLSKEMQVQNKNIPVYIQVNTGSEPQKGGLDIEKESLTAFINDCKKLNLNVVGLMCIPPSEDEPSAHFAFLKKLATENGLEKVSMGMSADYELAIQQGATCVRVGTAIFGERK
ncbi:MAG: YggS family pyridoxal phosphate-dependent enzyme [Alphaproteobacteria bacterium]|nr:YggS family pyridoxal phosphate-dependent enzyme [Alphaproteobacteria bacterium]